MRYAIAEPFAVYGKFRTGRTITATLFNALTGVPIPVTSTVCVEIGTSGIYRFNSTNIVTPPTVTTSIVWQMTDSVSAGTDEGLIVVGASELSATVISGVWGEDLSVYPPTTAGGYVGSIRKWVSWLRSLL